MVVPLARIASGPRVSSTPTNPAAAPAAAPMPAPIPGCPAAAPANPPMPAPAPAASPMVFTSPALLPSLLTLPSALSSVSGAVPSRLPMRARKSRVTPLGSVKESKRTYSSPRPCTRPGSLDLGHGAGYVASGRNYNASIREDWKHGFEINPLAFRRGFGANAVNHAQRHFRTGGHKKIVGWASRLFHWRRG